MRNGLAIDYRGWIPNASTPLAYSHSKLTLHIPRRQYIDLLPGTPTIRVFEVLATGTCLISVHWRDSDGLFTFGEDFVAVKTQDEMREAIDWLARDDAARERIARHGLETILDRHTCDHRARQLLEVMA
jgi:spore maturation protein CgeB